MKKLLCFFLVILVLVSPALAADGSTSVLVLVSQQELL